MPQDQVQVSTESVMIVLREQNSDLTWENVLLNARLREAVGEMEALRAALAEANLPTEAEEDQG